MQQETVQLESPIEGLHASTPEALPFAPDIHIRAFLLPRSRGNLLIYSVSDLGPRSPAIQDLGGVSRQYLTIAMRRCSHPNR